MPGYTGIHQFLSWKSKHPTSCCLTYSAAEAQVLRSDTSGTFRCPPEPSLPTSRPRQHVLRWRNGNIANCSLAAHWWCPCICRIDCTEPIDRFIMVYCAVKEFPSTFPCPTHCAQGRQFVSSAWRSHQTTGARDGGTDTVHLCKLVVAKAELLRKYILVLSACVSWNVFICNSIKQMEASRILVASKMYTTLPSTYPSMLLLQFIFRCPSCLERYRLFFCIPRMPRNSLCQARFFLQVW